MTNLVAPKRCFNTKSNFACSVMRFTTVQTNSNAIIACFQINLTLLTEVKEENADLNKKFECPKKVFS